MPPRAAIARFSLLALSLTIAACANAPPPNAELALARSTISDAERIGATERAPMELNQARQRLALAEQAVRDNKIDQARMLAVEAEADARLARATSEAERTEQNARDLEKSNDALRQAPASRR